MQIAEVNQLRRDWHEIVSNSLTETKNKIIVTHYLKLQLS